MTDYVKDGEEFLQHYGAKGMKWGVRKDRGNVGTIAKNSKIRRLDRKFERNLNKASTHRAIAAKATANYRNTDMKRINKKRMYSGKKVQRDELLKRKYMAEHRQAMLKHMDKVAAEMGTNASGTRQYKVLARPDGKVAIIVSNVKKDVKHAADDVEEITLNIIWGSDGLIADVKIDGDDEMTQFAMDGADFLEHFGKKGMKWGVRKDRGGATAGTSDGRANNKPPLNPHQKAQLDAASGTKRGKDRSVYKKSPKQLSEAQLKARINRMELEKKYNDLNAEPVGKGKKMVEEVMQNSGKQIATTILVGAGLLAAKQVIGKKFGEEAAAAITGKGKKKKD